MSTGDKVVTPYEPKQYWNTREHPNTAVDPGLSPVEVNFLQPKLLAAHSVLEIGPGVGRLFPLYAGIERVCTVDLSTNYRDRAKEAARLAGVSVQDFYLSDPLAPLPFAPGEFDLGITSHVLMHVPFDNIEHSMLEATRVCRRVMVISAMHKYWPQKGKPFDANWHCFTHDYPAICAKLGLAYGGYTQFVQRELEGAFGFIIARKAADVA